MDETTVMSDWDMGEMFLNFNLHPDTVPFACIDVAPLDFTPTKCPHRWMCWTRNLMGFKASPYNSMRMYLVAEEIIRGDRHDPENAFQWSHLCLNLPGSKGYKPAWAWISKRRKDNSLASNFVCFVDNQRVTASSSARVVKAGHAISTKESYLGIQDALQKIQSPHRTRCPGAWAGSNVCIDEEIGVMVLTSQEKWDRLKSICAHWLSVIRWGESNLEYKRLLSDRGFLVYVTQAYPSMKPYLKGFHLSLETWRGGRDDEGWKATPKFYEEEPVTSMEEVTSTLMIDAAGQMGNNSGGPPGGFTMAVPRFEEDLEALTLLTKGECPTKQCVWNRKSLTAYYGFGDTSLAGLGATVECPEGLQGRFGLWGRDEEGQSSNYRELQNLVKTV
jgi:hypothetical protein